MDVNTRFLIISDTHGEPFSNISQRHADVAIHCGDLTKEPKLEEFQVVPKLLKENNTPLKLIMAGDHDFTMDIPAFKENHRWQSEKFYGGYGGPWELFEDSRAQGVIFLDEGVHRLNLQNGALLTVCASP
ncbi:Metallo-dependent phosphatase-like protein [Biscogniauxia marginata]|nr:Metallo-dependent phosphatase-like protein [Biscogniauxia marginata]